jgi:hypothetical protein
MRKTNYSSHTAGIRARIFIAKAAGISSGLLLLLAVYCSVRVQAQNAGSDDAKESGNALKLWGTAGEVRTMAGEPSMKLKVSLNVVAENTGKDNLLLLRRTPTSSSEEIVSVANPSVSLWRPEQQTASQSSDPTFPKLRKALDQTEPPEDEIITLGPGDSIGWNVVAQLDFAKGDGDRIRKACPCAVKLDLDLWPLEPWNDTGDPGFGRKLAKRWHKKGVLVFTAKQTDPIEIKLPDK